MPRNYPPNNEQLVVPYQAFFGSVARLASS